MNLNAADYPDLQSALDAAIDGDRVYVPAGIWKSPAASGFKIRSSIEVYGDGSGPAASSNGTVLVPGGPNLDLLAVECSYGALDGVYIHDLRLDQEPIGQVKPSRGVVCALASLQAVDTIRIERVSVIHCTGNGIHVTGADGVTGFVGRVILDHTICSTIGGYGAYFENVRLVSSLRGECDSGLLGGMHCKSCGVALYNAGFEYNGNVSAPTVKTISLWLESCRLALVAACRFENFYFGGPAIACQFDGCRGSAEIRAGTFLQGLGSGEIAPAAVNAVSISVPSSATGAGPVVVLQASHVRVHPFLVQVDASAVGAIIGSSYEFVEPGMPFTAGSVQLPGNPNSGMLSAAFVRRESGANDSVGVILPSWDLAADPTGSAQHGMIYMHLHGAVAEPRVCLPKPGQPGQVEWKAILLST